MDRSTELAAATIANNLQARNEYLAERFADAERTIQRQAAECIDLHAQIATLQDEVRYWRERALHCAEIEPEGT